MDDRSPALAFSILALASGMQETSPGGHFPQSQGFGGANAYSGPPRSV